ncbi:hypothetical protein BC826DRAFT_1001833 [Russula brevipes]|nr:hypothetical protein BC826DRAFT_1001833 [Russula brevipes]
MPSKPLNYASWLLTRRRKRETYAWSSERRSGPTSTRRRTCTGYEGRRRRREGPHAVLVSASNSAYEQAIDYLRPGGSPFVVSLPAASNGPPRNSPSLAHPCQAEL